MDRILSLIEHYGYLLILFGVMLESTGVPLPGETILIASGILVQRGHLDLGDVIFFGILGAVLGDQIGYWIGREGGRPFILRWGRYVFISPERLARAEAFFERHGGKAVFLARFFSGLRVFGALVAGMSRMRWGTFILYNALGGAVWATAVILVGYFLGSSIGLVERWLGKASLLLGILAFLAVVLYLFYRWATKHPEQLRRAFQRLGGRRIQRFLDSPAGFWLRRRFSPRGAYGLALSAGLVLMGLFSWAFGGIAEDLVSRDPLVRVDVRILEFFHSHSAPAFTTAILIFDSIFSPEVLLLAGAVAGCVLVFLAYKRDDFIRGFSGIVLLAAALGTGVLSELFKILFHRPSPPASLRLVDETGSSFPSAHAMAAVTIGAAVWYLLSLRPAESRGGTWRAKARVALAVVALALLVGLGQVYTGAHYPSDVLAGWALGGVWASICVTAAELFRRLRASGEQLPETGVKYAQVSLVGASNALVDLGTLNLLLLIWPTREPGLLVLYNLLALTLTNANSYLWNTLWTFKHHARHDARQVGMFAAQAALSIGVGSLVLWLVARGLVSYEALSPLVAGNAAKIVSMIVGSTTSFVILRFFVFRREKKG
jgi:membrane protein DedA with SNARE-associated domain/membrane-associated phospholipid phosphatase/putative flippase GtrA